MLYSTWSIDSFFFEMLSEATVNIGPHEKIDYEKDCNMIDFDKGFLEYKKLAFEKTGKTYYPEGMFNGYLVPHEETITIAKSLEVKDKNKVVYRPSVVFLYSPCDYSIDYLKNAKVGEYTEQKDILHDSKTNNEPIIRGYKYPKRSQIVYKENINSGTEYVGVLLLGSKFNPVWVGNRIERKFLYKNKND